MNRVDESRYNEEKKFDKDDDTTRIASNNDSLRHHIFDAPYFKITTIHRKDKIVLSKEVSELNTTDKMKVLRLVKEFDTFTQDDDPYKEHDFGAFDYKDIKYFWKIDYYDNDLKFHSEDKLNAEKTIKVLTVMKASEY